MKYFNDKWWCETYCQQDQVFQVLDWMSETFGPNWGVWYPHGNGVDRLGRIVTIYGFHKIEHANWFQLKWVDINLQKC